MSTYKPTKRWEVDAWLHKPSGQTLRLYYDKDSTNFWAQIADRTVKAKTQDEAKRTAEKLANDVLCGEDRWRRLIFISSDRVPDAFDHMGHSADGHSSPLVGFNMKRCWVAEGGDGRLLTRNWNRSEDSPWASEMAKLWDVETLHVNVGENRVEISYSDETWEALMALSVMLDAARKRLDEIVHADDFVPLLLARVTNLLMPPEDKT